MENCEMRKQIDRISTRRLKKNKYFPYIEEVLLEVVEEFPIILSTLCKVGICNLGQNGADAGAVHIWQQHLLSLECQHCLYFDEKFISRKNIDKCDIKGLIWHEIGHILSMYCYKDIKDFYINKSGRISTRYRKLCKNEIKYRLIIIDGFWRENEKYYNKLKRNIGQHLTEENNIELLSECFKYAYAGTDHYGNDPFFQNIIQMAKSVVHEFNLKYLC